MGLILKPKLNVLKTTSSYVFMEENTARTTMVLVLRRVEY